MKTFLKTVSMIAICLAATIQFSSCSSDNEDDVPTQEKNFDVTGKWMTMIVQPIETDMDYNEFATYFQTPFIEFSKDGSMNWHELDEVTGDPLPIKNKGTYSVKGEKITISAPGNKWMNGTHLIECMENGVMEWRVNTKWGSGRFYFTVTVHNNL